MYRDEKGRFCKPSDIDIIPPPEPKDTEYGMPEPGDIAFNSWMRWTGSENKSLPHHYTVRAHKVEEITEGGTPVCYPWPNNPDEPMYLDGFCNAKDKAIDETTSMQLIMNKDMAEDYHMLASNPKYEKLAFNRPKDFKAPLYVPGEEVYGVIVTSMCGLQLRACRGVIIGMLYQYENDTSGGMAPGWNYQVYFQEEATEKDRYYGDKPGDIKENYDWVHESNVYKDQQQALKVFLAQTRRINADYAQILGGLRKLKVEDVEPPKE